MGRVVFYLSRTSVSGSPLVRSACIALAIFGGAPQSLRATDNVKLEAELTIIQAAALKRSEDNLIKEEAAYRRAKTAFPDQGSVDYAWSLALRKQGKLVEAAEFQKQAAESGTCLAARIAEMRPDLRSGNWDSVGDQLVVIAEEIGDSNFVSHPDDRKYAAWFLGRVFEYLTTVLDHPKAGDQMLHRQRAIERMLLEYVSEFETGRASLSQEARKWQDQVVALIEKQEEKRVADLRDSDQKSKDLETKYKMESDRTARTREVVGEKVSDFAAQLTSLEKQYLAAAASEEKITGSIADLMIEQQKLINDLNRIYISSDRYPAAKAIYNEQISIAQVEIELLKADLVLVSTEKLRLLKAAQNVMQHQAVGFAEQRAVDQYASKLADRFQKWQKDEKQRGRKIAESSVTDSSRVDGLRRKAQSWGTYDHFSIESEFKRLIKPDFNPAPGG